MAKLIYTFFFSFFCSQLQKIHDRHMNMQNNKIGFQWQAIHSSVLLSVTTRHFYVNDVTRLEEEGISFFL